MNSLSLLSVDICGLPIERRRELLVGRIGRRDPAPVMRSFLELEWGVPGSIKVIRAYQVVSHYLSTKNVLTPETPVLSDFLRALRENLGQVRLVWAPWDTGHPIFEYRELQEIWTGPRGDLMIVPVGGPGIPIPADLGTGPVVTFEWPGFPTEFLGAVTGIHQDLVRLDFRRFPRVPLESSRRISGATWGSIKRTIKEMTGIDDSSREISFVSRPVWGITKKVKILAPVPLIDLLPEVSFMEATGNLEVTASWRPPAQYWFDAEKSGEMASWTSPVTGAGYAVIT